MTSRVATQVITEPTKLAKAAPVFTLKEVAVHSTPTDCWVIVHGKVYDVSEFVPRHPGGSMIYVKAGGDCSQLFDSYHPLRANRVLDKYEIGTLDPKEVTVTYQKQGDTDDLHIELKKEVEAYFRQNKLHPRFSSSMYIKTALILSSIAVLFYATFFQLTNFPIAFVCSTVLGLMIAEVGVSIQHDANHGAYSRNTWVTYIAGLTLDAAGASSFMWKQQHVVGHHAFTNVHGEDPDIRVKLDGTDVRRLTGEHPMAHRHQYQHVYLFFLYGLLAIKSVVYDDFAAIIEGEIGPVRIAKFQPYERVTFWATKVAFLSWFFVLPAVYGTWSAPALVALWTWTMLCEGWMLAFMFQVAHVVEDVTFLKMNKDKVVPGSWAEQQIATSADFCHNSFFWTHFSGGLNYQVIHHLFPGIIHTHYPALAPIVQKVAKKYGVKYQVYDTFWAAFKSHFEHLRRVGGGLYIPSLQTVG